MSYRLVNIWNEKSEDVVNEIIQFWLEEDAIPDEEIAKERVDQVVVITKDTQQKIVGLCTVYERYNQQLENYFYYFRTFVSASHRRSNMARTLIVETRKFFESRFRDGINTKVIGMFVVVENAVLKKYRNDGIWPSSRFVYIGKNEQGDHLRVYYFEGARINQEHLQ